MKISKRVWIDENVKWNSLRKRAVCKKYYYKGHAYFVCTSPHQNLLFEIVDSSMLSSWYKEETVLAICKTRQQAFEQVRVLVDALYNTQTLTLSMLE